MNDLGLNKRQLIILRRLVRHDLRHEERRYTKPHMVLRRHATTENGNRDAAMYYMDNLREIDRLLTDAIGEP